MTRRLVLLIAAATLWFGALAQRTDRRSDLGPVGSSLVASIDADDFDDLAPELVVVDAPAVTAVLLPVVPTQIVDEHAPSPRYLAPPHRPPRTFA